MPRYRAQAANFSAGEISPGAQDRIDSAVWQAGAEHLENVLVRRSGGVRTRPGLRQVDSGEGVRTIPIGEEKPALPEGTPWQRYLGSELEGTTYTQQGFYPGRRIQEKTLGADGAFGYVRPYINPDVTEGPIAGFDFQAWHIRDLVNGGLQAQVVVGADTFNVTVDGQPVADGNAAPLPGRGHLRYMRRLFQLRPDNALPIRSIFFRGITLRTSVSLIDLRRTGPLTYFQVPANNVHPGYEARKWYPRYALIGSVAGLPREQWFSLTGTGPFDDEASVRAGALIIEDQNLIPELLVPLNPRPVAWTPTQLSAMHGYLQLGNREVEGLAFDRIALVELALDVNPRTGSPDYGGGQIQWFIEGVSATYNTIEDTLGFLKGTQASAVRTETASETPSVTPTTNVIRMVEWAPAPGRSYLVQVSRQGVYVTQVPPPGRSLPEPRQLPYAFADVPLSEIVFAEAPNRLYLFHERLAEPLVLSEEDAVLSLEPFTIAADQVPAGPDGPYWGPGGSGVRAGVFAYGRLCLIGSGRYPNMLAFSQVGDPTRFVPPAGTPTPDQPFHALTSGTESLHGAVLGRRLVMFGERAEYFLSAEEISGRRLDFQATSAHGSPRGGRALVVDDTIVFRQGRTTETSDLRMMIFSDEESGFRTPSLAPFSSHLVRGISAYTYQSAGEDGGARLWCVRSNGTLSVLSIDRAAQVNAWTRATLPSGVVPVEIACIDNRVFVLCAVAGSPRLFEVSYSDTTGSVLDLATVADPWTTGTILRLDPDVQSVVEAPPYNGQIRIVSSLDPPFTANVVNGVVELPEGAVLTDGARVEAGLPVQWSIRTLPVVLRTASGTAISVQKTRIVRSFVDYEITPGPAPLLAIQRIREVETYRPERIQWPRRIEVEDSRGIWMPNVILPEADSEAIMRAKLGPQRGWKNRTTLALRGRTPCTMVGISYMVAGGA